MTGGNMIKPAHGIACFAPAEVFVKLKRDASKIGVPVGEMTYFVKAGSLRYRCFERDRCRCICCGLMGTQMWLERNLGRPGMPEDCAIFNLYGEEAGELVLFTKDHIVPKARGGRDCLSNLQTMCLVCNQIKADSRLNLDQILLIRRLRENDNDRWTGPDQHHRTGADSRTPRLGEAHRGGV